MKGASAPAYPTSHIHANMPVVTPATLGTNPNANVSQ
jgi:hypothetical protein